MNLSNEQRRQRAEYRLPYHYFCSVDLNQNNFSSFKWLPFSVGWALGLHLVYSHLVDSSCDNWIDVGCGDGAALASIHQVLPLMQKCGVDMDHRAISFAKLINPEIPFICSDVFANVDLPSPAHTVSLLEVLEHIPPELALEFLCNVGRLVDVGGYLLITVPHVNQRMAKKHYRHFDHSSLKEMVLEALPDFDVVCLQGFNKKSWLERLVKAALTTKHVFLELSFLNKLRLRRQQMSIPVNSAQCQQLFMKLRRIS